MSQPLSVLPHITPGELRGMEQFGRMAGKQARHDLLRRVREGDVQYARKLTRSRTVIVLVYAGQELAFVYSNASKQILHFLPPGAQETADWRRSRLAARALFPRPQGGYR